MKMSVFCPKHKDEKLKQLYLQQIYNIIREKRLKNQRSKRSKLVLTKHFLCLKCDKAYKINIKVTIKKWKYFVQSTQRNNYEFYVIQNEFYVQKVDNMD